MEIRCISDALLKGCPFEWRVCVFLIACFLFNFTQQESALCERASVAVISQIPKSGQHANTLRVSDLQKSVQETNDDDMRRSLRVSRELPSLDFRSLTLPRKPQTSQENPHNDGNESRQQDNHLPPVPAPRYYTLKRHPYQNIPLPKKSQAGTQQLLEVGLSLIHFNFR